MDGAEGLLEWVGMFMTAGGTVFKALMTLG